MPYTYPPSGPTLSGDAVTIHRMLANPTLVARRLRTLLEQRYIADAILKGRFQVFGGAIAYETGEPIGTAENPRAVAPGAEYPLVKARGRHPVDRAHHQVGTGHGGHRRGDQATPAQPRRPGV